MMGKDLSGNGREKVEQSLECVRETTESAATAAATTTHDAPQSPTRQHIVMTTTLVLMPENPVQIARHQFFGDEEVLLGRRGHFSYASPAASQLGSSAEVRLRLQGQLPTTREPLPRVGFSPTQYRGHMIPDIVIEPIPPRDSFGHSHTPPLVQRQWGLSSPSSGKKVRALSDSSIIELEKTQRQMPEAQPHIPARGFHSAHEFHADLSTSPEQRPFQKDADQPKAHLQGYEHKMVSPSSYGQPTSEEEKHTTGSPSPMEVDNSNNVKSLSSDVGREMEHSGYTYPPQTSVHVSQGVMVSSATPSSLSSLAFHTPEKSPKMYWLRRHSDSRMPDMQEQTLAVSQRETSRSQSVGDADKLEHGGQATESKESERQDTASLVSALDKPSAVSPTSSLPRSPTGHTIFSERIKLKKYLQKRYQSSLDEDSGLREDEMKKSGDSKASSKDDVASTSLTSTVPEAMALDVQTVSSTMAPPSKKPPRLSLQETVPLKVEPISPPSESETEPETPVFFSPSFVSPRVFSESAHWCHNVFQFPSRGHQLSAQSTESRAPSSQESLSSPFATSQSSPLEMKDISMEGAHYGSEQQPKQRQEEWLASAKTVKGEETKSKGDVCQSAQVMPQSSGKEEVQSTSPTEGSCRVKSMQGIDIDVQHSHHFSPLVYHAASIKPRATPAMGRSRSEGHMPSRPLSPILRAQRAPSPAAGSPSTSAASYLGQQEQVRISGFAGDESEFRKSQMSPQPGFVSITGQHSVVPHSQFSPSQYTSQSVHPPFSSYMTSSPTFSARPAFQWSSRSRSQGMATSPPQTSQEQDTVRQLPPHFRSLPLPVGSTSTAGSSGSSTRRTDPSKMICCPFGDKIREQRLSQDPGSVFRCPVCSQLFPSYYYLANHMVNHLPSEVVSKGPGDSNKIHLCKVCNRAFSRSDMLTRHMRLHTGLKPYECHTCGQVFSRSDHLHTHQRTHTGEKPYKCPQCPYAAPRRDMITRHMRIHMKHFTRRGRRTSSTSSDVTPQSSTETAEVKRRNQSLSSIDSLESDQSSFRQSSTASTDPEHADVPFEERRDEGRNWSLTSAESVESASDVVPSTSSSRHWSAASAESAESYAVPSPSYPQTEPEEAASPSVPSVSAGTISTDVQTSFQRCAVTSDTSSSSSDRDKSSPASVTMEGCSQSK